MGVAEEVVVEWVVLKQIPTETVKHVVVVVAVVAVVCWSDLDKVFVLRRLLKREGGRRE